MSRRPQTPPRPRTTTARPAKTTRALPGRRSCRRRSGRRRRRSPRRRGARPPARGAPTWTSARRSRLASPRCRTPRGLARRRRRRASRRRCCARPLSRARPRRRSARPAKAPQRAESTAARPWSRCHRPPSMWSWRPAMPMRRQRSGDAAPGPSSTSGGLGPTSRSCSPEAEGARAESRSSWTRKVTRLLAALTSTRSPA
mmetsp:Transcript_87499/g.244906  ORF Transcript_87499/g.244906 Transcript_87499/m.244906 type:complete len:200 (+) Transcript_87499:639-1238(+)